MEMMIDVEREIRRFAWRDVSPRAELLFAAKTFAAWSTFGCALATLSKWPRASGSWAYMGQAAADALGANLWNVMGVGGCALIGLMVIVPRSARLARAASGVWANTFAVGCLGIGVLAGRLPFALAGPGIPAWQAAVCGAVGVILLAYMVALNGMAWYFGFLARSAAEGGVFGEKLAEVDLRLRAIVGTLLVAGPLALLALEH